MRIAVATRNREKLKEIRRLFEGPELEQNIELPSLEDFPGAPEVEETGNTFEENSVKKALSLMDFTGLPAIADDSGLEVHALKGAPGVRSARYAGERATDKDNVEKLLREMARIPDEKRGARFICVIALAYPDGRLMTFAGTVEGKIGKEPKGKGGFGYDPVFYPEGYERTFAEMTPAEKDALSHRAEALRKLREHLKG